MKHLLVNYEMSMCSPAEISVGMLWSCIGNIVVYYFVCNSLVHLSVGRISFVLPEVHVCHYEDRLVPLILHIPPAKPGSNLPSVTLENSCDLERAKVATPT